MTVTWHPKRWWGFCLSEDGKKINRTNFYRGVVKVCVSSMQYGSIRILCHIFSQFCHKR